MALGGGLWVTLCRSSYYVSLLGLKIPLGLLVRASRARHVLAFLLFLWVPYLIFSHVVIIPSVPTMRHGIPLWHFVTAAWVTIPLLIVASVILPVVRSAGHYLAFSGVLAFMACFHGVAIPAIIATPVGGALLHAMQAFFEDLPAAAWIWCLLHVVRLQDHVRQQQAARESPFGEPRGLDDRVLIVGNAPTVTDGPPLGAVIDGFRHVVRFNSYSVARPAFTGTKVGFHFSNGRNFPTAKTVRAVLPLFNASLTHAAYLFMPHLEDARETYASLTSSDVDAWFVDEELLLRLRQRIGCRVWQVPTSGMVAIGAFLEKRQQVFLHGFNFFEGKKIHYFEESPVQLITSWLERFVTHDPSREKVWVAGLMKEGRATFLSQACAPAGAEGRRDAQDEDVADSPKSSTKLEEKERKLDSEDGELRRRTPGLVQTLLKDGFPSQFSL